METAAFVPVLVVGFATSLGLTPLSRAIALRLGVVDKPAQRKIHRDNKPLMGGLALYGGLAVALVLFSPPAYLVEFSALLAGGALLAVVGLLDDRYHLGIRVRLVAQAAAGLILIAAGIGVHLFGTPWLDVPLTLLWVLTITNATNFLDNMDGLTAGFTAIAGAFFTFIAVTQGLTLVSMLAAALTGSAVGFLIYNFNPASTFMGDMGALVLGFILAALGIKLEFGAQPPGITWAVPVFVLALPVFDITLVVITRLREGRSPGEAGKDHTSHRLMSIGLSQRQTIAVLYTGCALFGVLGVLVGEAPQPVGFALAVFGGAVMAALFALMTWIRARFQRPAAPRIGAPS
jgi:UDP-GlcNAc:undecaprenyl-phosphate GlcNAc-1-phosphate transferase